MLPLASSFRLFFCNFLLSVFGAIISHVFNSPCRIQADESETITPIQAKPDYKIIRQPDAETISVLASNSSRYQLEPTTQIHGFIEESETTNCFVEELFYASPSSGNQFSSRKYFWEFCSETENFIEIFRDEEKDFKSSQDGETLGEDCSLSLSDSDSGSLCFDEEYIEIELEPQLHVLDAKVLPVNDWSEENEDSFEESKETEWDEKRMEFEEEEEEEEELLQEHQDLIKQLKMELRNSRTGGLPTVLEEEEEEEPESISPTSVQALRPLKQAGNFEHKEHFKEIHKMYKAYAEKMRKLDVSNTQTNYAIGFVKLKDPISPIDGRKSVVKSLFSHKLRPGRAEKRCPRLMRDLEMVYVGHLCLSWEILHWQYRKAIQLQQIDSGGTYRYSQVVNEFQLFCILVQRFIEDEWFCSSRIENYAKNRLLVRSLLQVPAIREDCVNDKRPRGRDGENTISTAALVSIIEDSMRVFREFLQTDKDKCAKVQLHYNPFDAQMMMEIRTGLRKKEKRLKDIVRSGNCILNKLQSQRIAEEGNLKNELLIAEVELKLVWRVVSMSRLTEKQLIWCHEKLHQVNFVNRKLVLEPSFLLFPCSL